MAETGPPIANAGVRFPPPFLFMGGLVVGWLIDRYVRPLPLTRDPNVLVVPALLVIALGLVFMFSGVIAFHRAHTAIVPNLPASRLVQSGPYRFTRNPMYTGLTIASVGVAMLIDSAWPLILLPVVLLLLVRLVIRREEAYLRSAFGAEYEAYTARVRRWL